MTQPFGIVAAGLPVLVQPAQTPLPTSFVYTIPASSKPFSHVVVFLLPGVVLPDNTAAAIYLVTPPAPGQSAPGSRFLGGLGPGKESAIFKLTCTRGADVVLGINIEDVGSVSTRIAELAASKQHQAPQEGGGSSQALVSAAPAPARNQPSTLVLAQRIIKNAFDFLASFSGQAGQVEVVPLKAFESWWQKFESRVRSDPGFLERDGTH